MTDIFSRQQPQPPSADFDPEVNVSSVPLADAVGHSLKLKIRQKALAPGEGGVPGLGVELSIDGHPLSGLLQEIKFKIDANTLVPVFSLTLIPTDVELDMDANLVALLPPEVKRVYCLTKPGQSFLGKSMGSSPEVEKLLQSYRENFPTNQRSSDAGSIQQGSDPTPG